MHFPQLVCWSLRVLVLAGSASAADGNRLAYLDEFCNPYYVGLDAPRLATPQWIGEEGVEAAIVLSIDDLGDTAHYEEFLRPILKRLQRIDGHAPVSIMTKHVNPNDPFLPRWYKEGLSLEAHAYDHPCPCLKSGEFEKAKATYDRCVDVMALASQGRTTAFRMPCCDSMNSASPAAFAKIFNCTSPRGNFLSLDSSVFMLFTADDPRLPRDLVVQDNLHRGSPSTCLRIASSSITCKTIPTLT